MYNNVWKSHQLLSSKQTLQLKPLQKEQSRYFVVKCQLGVFSETCTFALGWPILASHNISPERRFPPTSWSNYSSSMSRGCDKLQSGGYTCRDKIKPNLKALIALRATVNPIRYISRSAHYKSNRILRVCEWECGAGGEKQKYIAFPPRLRVAIFTWIEFFEFPLRDHSEEEGNPKRRPCPFCQVAFLVKREEGL